MTLKYVFNKSISSANKISKSDYQKLSKNQQVNIKKLKKKLEFQGEMIEPSDAMSALQDSFSRAGTLGIASMQSDAMRALQGSLNRAGTLGIASMQSDAVRALQGSLNRAGTLGIASMQSDAVRALQGSLNRAGTLGIASMQSDAVRALQGSVSRAGTLGIASMQSDAVRALQNSLNGSFKTIIANLDVEYAAYRNKQYALIANAQESQWFLDEDLVDNCLEEQLEREDTIFIEEKAVQYITEHFDEYINEIVNSPCYVTQKKIINQSVDAYTSGHYEMAIFPLFGAFDNVISRWAQGILTKPYQHQNVYIHNFRGILKKNIRKNTEVAENIRSINLLKGLTVINAYIDLFDSKPSDLTKINRNAILHGSFNYELLNQNSYLKMTVLLKSALALLDVSLLELNIQISE